MDLFIVFISSIIESCLFNTNPSQHHYQCFHIHIEIFTSRPSFHIRIINKSNTSSFFSDKVWMFARGANSLAACGSDFINLLFSHVHELVHF